jgi:putative tryptophan/tyrosine transport system substrate-binding protein
MNRRQVITLLGGTAAAWPLAVRAQQSDRGRRIGILMPFAADDPEALARITVFAQGLQELGWSIGHTVRVDYRWSAADPSRMRSLAAELVALAPDVILATGSAALEALQQATRTVPIVFLAVVDPVGAGYIATLAHPGGNATGFTLFEYGISGKWVEVLKEIAPNVRRVAILREPALASAIGQFAVIQSAASSLGLEISPVDMRDAGDIESAVAALARGSNGGIIVPTSALAVTHRDLIIAVAARYRLPAVYPLRLFVTGGGLISYGPDIVDPYRRAAGYVDRILKGEKPADLPVQAPVKYETVINHRTAKALGLTVPDTLLALADDVIE